jgi:hypothetical protein
VEKLKGKQPRKNKPKKKYDTCPCGKS